MEAFTRLTPDEGLFEASSGVISADTALQIYGKPTLDENGGVTKPTICVTIMSSVIWFR